jgi:hypothetical protein
MGTTKVTASVSSDDIRRQYYETAGYSMWISELQVNPLQLIVEDDATGKHYRVPITLSGDSFTLGDAIEVAVEYVDAASPAAAATARTRAQGMSWASRDASRAGVEPARTDPPTDPPAPPAKPVNPADAARRIHNAPVASQANGPTQEGPAMDPAKLREALGLAADASDDEVSTALAAAGLASKPSDPPTDPPEGDPAAALPPKVPTAASGDAILLDPAQYNTLRVAAARGEDAWRKMREAECGAVLDAAIKAGKFPPARREHYEKLWAADPDGTKDMVANLASNVIPVMSSGYPGVGDESEQDLVYAAMYPDSKVSGGVGRG